MRKILVAECKQEVSSFNPHPSSYDDFTVKRGTDFFAYHRRMRYEVGGALAFFDGQPGYTVIPALGAASVTSGGLLHPASWRRLADEFLDAIRNAPRPDGVYCCLHGAMASHHEDDPEGYLLAQLRQLLGPDVPIVASFDLHGVLTDRILSSCDAIVSYHTYPHVDFFETGTRAARLLHQVIAGSARPVTAKVAIPALVRGDQLITDTGSFGEVIRLARSFEATAGCLSAGVFIGNPFTDVPDLQSYAYAVTHDDPAAASRMAGELATEFWHRHEQMRADLTPLAELEGILAQASGTVGLVDAADATSSGASGDSNIILRELVRCGYRGRALIPIVAPAAAKAAFAAGVGATVDVTVGGDMDPGRFMPLAVRARVRLLSSGPFPSEAFGVHWDAGPTAVLEADNLTLVAASRAVNFYDRSFFFAHGRDPRNYDAVVIKSPHCQHHMYAAWCSRLVNLDAPGSSSANLSRLGHRRCPRPIFPLDPEVPFAPAPRLFSPRIQP